MAMLDCRYFTGYKPCGKNPTCERSCAHYAAVKQRVLIIHLAALGAVLRSTSLLAAIQRKYPQSHITWITQTPALLAHLEEIDRVLSTQTEDLLKLRALHFDVALVIDKSLQAAGLLALTHADQVFGFKVDPRSGAIVPANAEAMELWEVGLSDEIKFFKNQKSEQQLIHESLALGPYQKDEYRVRFSPEELSLVEQKRKHWSGRPILGINTGCSPAIPYKKLTVETHRELIVNLQQKWQIVLLGGPEDSQRNQAIARGLDVIQSSTTLGLREGLTSVAACDVVLSGDSLGLHMAIALKKWVVVWFGPTVAAEIELYGRGQKLQSSAPCSPCWKRVCHQPKMCYAQLDLDSVMQALDEGLSWLISSSKPLIPEMSFLPFPC